MVGLKVGAFVGLEEVGFNVGEDNVGLTVGTEVGLDVVGS